VIQFCCERYCSRFTFVKTTAFFATTFDRPQKVP
jgi:hypothetical protein